MNTVDQALIEAIAHEAGDFYLTANAWSGWDLFDGPGQKHCIWRITSESADFIHVYFYNGEPVLEWLLTLEASIPFEVTKATALAAIRAQEAIR